MPTETEPGNYRWRLVAVTLVCYLGLVLWPEFMAAMGVGHGGVWFLDINTLLASNDAVVRGLDPYQANPLDYLQGSHVYSDWWLQLRHFDLGRKDRLWLGALINVIFFAAFFWQARVRTFHELLVLWLLIWSPALILGFNRAQPDLLIYALLVPVVPLYLGEKWPGRLLACGLITLAIGLKYYPVIACAVIFLTARSRRELALWILIWAVIGVALAVNLYDDLARTPAPGVFSAQPDFCTFGAAALGINLGQETVVMALGLGLAFAAVVTGWLRPVFQTGGSETADRVYFFLGAGLITGCFFMTVSYIYRLVFALMMVRWLFTVVRSEVARERAYAWVVLLLSLVVFWADGLVALAVNMNLDSLPRPQLARVTDALVAVIHAVGWLWTLLLLAGLGTMGRLAWERWRPGGTVDQAAR